MKEIGICGDCQIGLNEKFAEDFCTQVVEHAGGNDTGIWYWLDDDNQADEAFKKAFNLSGDVSIFFYVSW